MISIYETKFILIYCIAVCFILGTVFGSFLNCVADRIYHNIPWWKGRSVCDNCNHKLGILDLFPVFFQNGIGQKQRQTRYEHKKHQQHIHRHKGKNYHI